MWAEAASLAAPPAKMQRDAGIGPKDRRRVDRRFLPGKNPFRTGNRDAPDDPLQPLRRGPHQPYWAETHRRYSPLRTQWIQLLCSRYQRTVLRRPVSRDSSGPQPSSVRSRVKSMA